MKITLDIPDETLCALWLSQWGENQLKNGIPSPSPESLCTALINSEALRYTKHWPIGPDQLTAWRSTLPEDRLTPQLPPHEDGFNTIIIQCRRCNHEAPASQFGRICPSSGKHLCIPCRDIVVVEEQAARQAKRERQLAERGIIGPAAITATYSDGSVITVHP